ncbi:HAD superfamily hydrolase (TIGR01450 family) [Homoserinimonas aerilata]|uniref:HAD superfamily hydrolase (TIGR01450 family) n=1 Tax=Homoserinimonas aerilata TaxID=1162970 RepID=A0A542YJR4_9MICO|nr:HAD superfamily hydrolase (TIGR01450 family) [Homoserinimonas aerilata]
MTSQQQTTALAPTSPTPDAAPEATQELPPLHGVGLILADLDGVVYKGANAIPHAVDSLNRADARVGYITNNASRTAVSVAEHLSGLGLQAREDDVVTSSQAAVRLLRGLVDEGSEILVVGGEGLIVEVERAGFSAVFRSTADTAAVIQGFAPQVGWEMLAEAAFSLQGEHAERPWVATNNDWTIPVARGIAPGNGTLVSAVHTAVGRLPVVAGKPEVAIFESAIERFGSGDTLFIGDRLDTDILGANRAGIRSAHVLTGVDGAKQLLAADKTMRPTFILGDLRGLFESYPAVRHGQDGLVEVGDAAVSMRGNRVELVRPGAETDGVRLDLVRAASAAIWASGLAIYGIDVNEALLDELGIARP